MEPAPGLGAVDTVHNVGGPAVHGGVDGGHGRGLGGLDLENTLANIKPRILKMVSFFCCISN